MVKKSMSSCSLCLWVLNYHILKFKGVMLAEDTTICCLCHAIPGTVPTIAKSVN